MAFRRLLGGILAAGLLTKAAAQDSGPPPVRRAIPVEPPTAPAVPFDFDHPSPPPKAIPVASPVPAASAAPAGSSSSDATGGENEIRVAPAGSTGAAQSPDEAQLDLANGFYVRKNWEMAAPEYEKYLGQYANAPGRQTALFRLAECYRTMGNVNAAKENYETLLSSFAYGDFIGPAAFRLADFLFQEKDYAGALPLYRKATVRVKDPTVINGAKYYTARCLENMDDDTEARAVYEDLIESKENNPFREAGQLGLAQLLATSDRKPEALKQYLALAQEGSKPEIKAEALVKAGLLEIELNQTSKGAADLQKAIDLPGIGGFKQLAELGLLRILFDGGKYKQVIDTTTAEMGDFSDAERPEVMLLAANANRMMGNHDVAVKAYEQVAHDFPGSVYAKEARFERLVSLYSSNDPGLIPAIDEYLKNDPEPEKRDEVILIKAEALFKQKDYTTAAPLYAVIEDSRQLGNRQSIAIFRLGWCRVQTKDYQGGIDAFTKFLDSYPSNKLVPTALAERAQSYFQLKNLAASLKDWTDIINHYPKARERELALEQKALILSQQSDNAGMVKAYEQLLADYPKSDAAAEANYWIGNAAFEAKDYRNALTPLARSRELDAAKYFETATLRLILSYYYLGEKQGLSAEIDKYVDKSGKASVPPEVLRSLSTTDFKDGDFAASEKYLALLTSHDASHAGADDWLNLGRSQLKQEKFDAAAKSLGTFLKAVKEPYPRATGLLALGEAQLGLKQYDDAQKSADEALSLQPEGELNAQGREISGDIKAAQGDYDAAAKLYQSVAVVFDDPVVTPRCMEKAVQSYRKAGKEPEAAKIMNNLLSKYPEYQLAK